MQIPENISLLGNHKIKIDDQNNWKQISTNRFYTQKRAHLWPVTLKKKKTYLAFFFTPTSNFFRPFVFIFSEINRILFLPPARSNIIMKVMYSRSFRLGEGTIAWNFVFWILDPRKECGVLVTQNRSSELRRWDTQRREVQEVQRIIAHLICCNEAHHTRVKSKSQSLVYKCRSPNTEGSQLVALLEPLFWQSFSLQTPRWFTRS